MALSFEDYRGKVGDRIWYSANGVFAFLVCAPHTFGHSQLVVKICSNEEEYKSFSKAAPHIAACIKNLRTSLPRPEDCNWKSLAEYTKSSGPYEKTLVLRVSADEARDTYKIHLIPFFESHLDATNELYQVTHVKGPEDKGGLLHWLGKREVILDCDMRDGCDNELVKNRINSFHLQQLKSSLCGIERMV